MPIILNEDNRIYSGRIEIHIDWDFASSTYAENEFTRASHSYFAITTHH